MAPKRSQGQKRDAEVKAAPAPKRARMSPLLEAVLAAIEGASCLSAQTRTMLAAGVPCSLDTPELERDAFQATFVSMVGDALKLIEAKLEDGVKVDHDKLVGIQEKKKQLDEALDKAQSTASAADAEAEAAVLARSKAAEDLDGLKTTLAEKKDVLAAACKEGEQLENHRAAVQQGIDEHLEIISKGEADVKERKKHYAALLPVLEILQVDQSLVQVLASASRKATSSRGAIEKMSIETLDTSLRNKATDLAQKLASCAEAQKGHGAEIDEVQRTLQVAEEDFEKAKTTVTETADKSAHGRTEAAAAQKAVEEHEPEHAAAAAAHSEKELALRTFREYNIACFDLLKAKAPSVSKVEQTGEEIPPVAKNEDATAQEPQPMDAAPTSKDSDVKEVEEPLVPDQSRVLVAGG